MPFQLFLVLDVTCQLSGLDMEGFGQEQGSLSASLRWEPWRAGWSQLEAGLHQLTLNP